MSEDLFLVLSKSLPALTLPLTLALILIVLGLGLIALRAVRTGWTLVALATAMLWTAATPGLAMRAAAWVENQHPPVSLEHTPRADAIVVLGGGLRTPVPPRVDAELGAAGNRLRHAARLYLAERAPLIVVSGGNVFPDPRVAPEAHYAAALLGEWGIDEDAIRIEDRSRNTRENATMSATILRQEGISRVLLVTSALHMPRAMETFRAAGMEPIAIPTDLRAPAAARPAALEWIPTADALALSSSAVRETVGRIVYRYRNRDAR